MLSALYCLGVAACGVSYLLNDYTKNYKIKKQIHGLWDSVLMSSSDSNSSLDYDIKNIEFVGYGFISDISFNSGSNFINLRNLISKMESAFGGSVRFELNDDKLSAKMFVHVFGLPINEIDNLYFKWDKVFFKKNYYRTYEGETFIINQIVPISSSFGKTVGYRLNICIPEGLSYQTLEKAKNLIISSIGECVMEWDNINRIAKVEIIYKNIKSSTKFVPVKVNPWELYLGSKNNYENIILDFKTMPNLLIGGMQTSGKTQEIILSLYNNIIFNSKDDVRYYFNMLGVKQDFRLFRDVEHCDCYAEELEDCVSSLRHLVSIHKKRNKVFSKCKSYVCNVYEYERLTKNKMSKIILSVDEVTNFNIVDSDTSKIKSLKTEYNKLLKLIAREARNSGIYVIVICQRAGEETIDIDLRGFLCNKVTFKQTNKAGAYTILGDEEYSLAATKLDINSREFIYENRYGFNSGKSLFISLNEINNGLKKFRVPDKRYVIPLKSSMSVIKNKNSNKPCKWKEHADNKFNVI